MSGAVEPHGHEWAAGARRAWALTRYTSRRLLHRFGRALVRDAV